MIKRLLALTLLAATPASAQQIVRDVGFVGSEAARYDDARDEYLVSNLGERGNNAADGFIARVAPDGTVRELRWIATDLVDPLGIFLRGDALYVADIAAVRIFDRRTGALARVRSTCPARCG